MTESREESLRKWRAKKLDWRVAPELPAELAEPKMERFTSVLERDCDYSSFDPEIDRLTDGVHLLKYHDNKEQVVVSYRLQDTGDENIIHSEVLAVPDAKLLGEIQDIGEQYFLTITRVHFTTEELQDVVTRYENLITAYKQATQQEQGIPS